MRTVLVPVVAALCWIAEGQALAQEDWVDPDAEDPRPRHTITANPLSLLTGTFGLEVETASSKRSVGVEAAPPRRASWFVGPSFAYASRSENSTTSSLFGLGATAGVRIFTGDQAPHGFWLGPQLLFLWITGDSGSNTSAHAVAYDVAGLVGYTWVSDNGFVLSLGGGLQYINMKLELRDFDGTRTIGVDGVFPALRLAVGLAF